MSLLAAWRKHPTRRKELAELLQEPALQDALAIVKERCYDITFPPTGGSYSLLDFYALYGAKHMGYLEALTNFLDLAGIKVHTVPDRKPWQTILSEGVEGQPPKPQPET
jgi:hypothetical protein